MELCNRSAMTVCICHFATSCRKVAGIKHEEILFRILKERHERERFDYRQSDRDSVAMILFLIMILPDISWSGLKRW